MVTVKAKKIPPFEFVLEQLYPLQPVVKPMFGAFGVYVRDRIVLILRRRDSVPEDNGVWVSTRAEHHAGLRQEMPSMRSIVVLGNGATHWQVLPEEGEDFETEVMRVCELILENDPRIGIPAKKGKKK